MFESLAGRSVFVTGHTGFKGSWLCLWLEHIGAKVTGFALEPPTQPNNFSVSGAGEGLVDHHIGDIRDEDALHSALLSASPDVVLHLAAQSVVREGYRTPRETFEINTIGVACILDGVRKLGKPCTVLVVTSDKCYENREQVWGYRESDPFGGHDPYSASKGAAEIVVGSYRDSYFPPERLGDHGIKLASVRAGNVIGGGDWTSDALIVDVVRALAAGKPVELRNPLAYRPWQHVLDALSGYLTLASRLIESNEPDLCDGWNIGPTPGSELPVCDVVDLFLQEWGEGSWTGVSGADEPREAHTLRLCIDKAQWRLNWNPVWDMQQTLRHTVEWYREYYREPTTMRAYSLQQIEIYEKALTVASRTASTTKSNPRVAP